MPPIVIAAAIAAGGSIGGGLLAGRKSKQENTLLAQQAANAKLGGDFAASVLPEAKAGLESSQNFWQSIMSGDRTKVNETLGPQISNILDQYGAAQKGVAANQPRGGGSTAAETNLRFSETGDVTKFIEGLFAQAPNEVSQNAEALGGLGTSALSGSTAAAGGGLNFLLAKDQQSAKTGASIGSGLGKLLYYYLNKQAGTSGGGGGGSFLTGVDTPSDTGLDTGGLSYA
jgi:hypothetical protein